MATSCPIVNSKQWTSLRGSLTETNITRLFNMHNGELPSVEVGRNEIYEEYGAIYGSVELNDSLPRPDSFFEYSNYLQQCGVNVLVGDEITNFYKDNGYRAYNPLSNVKKGIVVAESDILRYKQKTINDYGFAISLAKQKGKKVLVYRTDISGDIVIPLTDDLEYHNVGTKEDIEMFEQWHKVAPNAIEKAFMKVDNEAINDISEEHIDYGNDIVIDTFDRLVSELGVTYEIVSVDKAIEITQYAKDKFTKDSKESGFFYKGKIYLIKGRVNEKTALHELSHFVVRAIRLQNKELFDNMFHEAIQTEEGRKIYDDIKTKSEVENNADELREEVLATLLKINPEKASKRFETHNNNIWYYIKQFFRKLFGGNKLNKISKLNRNTTLYELADMIQEGGIKTISSRGMELSDVVLYDGTTINEGEFKFNDKEIKKLDDIFKMMNFTLKNQISKIPKGKVYEYMMDCGLIDDLKQKLVNVLPTEKNIINKIYQTLDQSVDNTSDRLTTFVKVCNGFAQTMINMNDALTTFKVMDNTETVSFVRVCIDIINNWQSSFNLNNFESIEDFETKKMILNRIGNINRLIESNKSRIKKLEREALVPIMLDELGDMRRSAEEDSKYSNILNPEKKAKLDSRTRYSLEVGYYGMTEQEYKDFLKLYAQWKDGTLTENSTDWGKFDKYCKDFSKGVVINAEKLELLIAGRLSDMGVLSQWMDSYINTQDPLIVSFQSFLKDNYSKAINKTERFSNKMYDTLSPLLKKAGFTAGQEKELMEALCSLDTIYAYSQEQVTAEEKDYIKKLKDEENITELNNPEEFHRKLDEYRKSHSTKKEVKVWTLMNEFINYRADHDKLIDEKNIAAQRFQDDNSQKNYDEYVKASNKLRMFERVFMNQEYLSEVYEVDDLMNDDLGQKALAMRLEIFNAISELRSQLSYTSDDDNIKDQIGELNRKYKFLISDYTETGQKKTGEDLEIAQRLRQYKELKDKYYHRVLHMDSFIEAYGREEQKFADIFGRNTPEYYDALDKWKQENVIDAGSDYYYEKVNELYEKINELRGETNPTIKEYLEELQQLTRPYRDEYGNIHYSQMNENIRSRVDELQNKITTSSNNDFSKVYVTVNGKKQKIDADGIRRFENIDEEISLYGTAEGSDLDFWKQVVSQLYGNTANSKELIQLYTILSSYKMSVPSSDYLDELNGLLRCGGNLSTISRLMPQLLVDNKFTEETAMEFLNEYALIETLRNNNKEFKNWFDRCHSSKNYGGKTYFKRKYVYSRSKIADSPKLHQITEFDVNGQHVILNGVPNFNYSHYEVRPEYINERIEGKTVDNCGRWLPKSWEEMDKISDDVFEKNGFTPADRHKYHNEQYRDLKAKNNDLYKLLEAVKKLHLETQKNADYGCKLYYDIPRYRMDNYDLIKSDDIVENIKARFRENWGVKSSPLTSDRSSYKDAFNLVRANGVDEFMQPKAPIHGLYNIDYRYVSNNILFNMVRYNMDINKADALRESYGVAMSVQDIANEQSSTGTKRKRNGDYGTRRARIINNIIDTDFYGKYSASLHGEDNWAKIIDSAFSKMNKLASFSYFAFDWYSSTKNYTGQKFQQLVESLGNSSMSPIDLAKGDVLAAKAMAQVLKDYKANGHKSLILQLGEVFDFIQGRSEEKMGSEIGNSIKRTMFGLQFPTAMRKHGEFHATYQLGYAKLYGLKIKGKDNNLYNGTEIYELDDEGTIRLKDGFDVRYDVKDTIHIIEEDDTYESILARYNIDDTEENRRNIFGNINLEDLKLFAVSAMHEHYEKIEEINKTITDNIKKEQALIDEDERYRKKLEGLCSITIKNTQFAKLKKDINGTFNVCNGAYSHSDANLLSRTIIGKPMIALKKYFWPMFVNKYLPRSMSIRRVDGKIIFVMRPRYDGARQTVNDPIILSAFATLGRLITFKNPFLCKDDKTNLAKAVFEFAWVGIINKMMIYALLGLFGDDDDDDLTPEEFRKLKREKFKALSPAATWWDIPADFSMSGWLRQRAINHLLLFEQEQAQFSTKPGLMVDVVMPRLVTFGPTIENYTKILGEFWDLGKEAVGLNPDGNVFYSRDVGPYPWQQEGSAKVYSRIFRCIGLTGNNLDNFKKYEQVEQTYRMR